MRRRSFCLGAAGSLASAIPVSRALAEPVLGEPPRRPEAVTASAGGMRMTGGGRVGLDRATGLAPVLSAFHFGFLNGDHSLRKVEAVAFGDTADLGFADQNADDPITAAASWLNVPGAARMTSSASRTTSRWASILAGGPHGLTLGPLGPYATDGFTLLLSGFSFETRDKADTQVMRLAAGVDEDDMAVALLQNGDNPRPRSPRENLVDCRLQFVWVPNSMIAARRSVTGSSPVRGEVSGQLPALPALVGIRYFDFRFLNGQHNILSLGVNLTGRRGVGVPSNEAVAFQDNNRDDPVQWRVDYVEFRPRS